jgi:hypothetical protein
MGCSPSGASFPGSADSTSGSSGPVCELCGNASRTSSVAGSSPGIGRGSRAIPTCAPLWPTPESSDATGGRVSGTPGGKRPSGAKRAVTLATAVAHAGTRCPCRCHTSTSSAAASPARTSPSPEGRPGSTGGARVFGASTFDSLTFFDRATSSWRTFATSLLATAADGSEEFSGTWPRAGMTRNGTVSRLAPLAPLTGGTASGLLPTPSAVSYGSNRGGSAGRTGPVRPSLQTMAAKNLWPSSEREMLPTPTRIAGTACNRTESTGQWELEPGVGRVAHGIPDRVDRLRALGNALVPQIAEWLGRRIVAHEEEARQAQAAGVA